MSAPYVATETEKFDGPENEQVRLKVAALPELPKHLLTRILDRLNGVEQQLALQHKILPVAWLPHLTLFAVVDDESARSFDLRPVARIAPTDFQNAIRRVLGTRILRHAVDFLKLNHPEYSAHRRVTLVQMLWFILVAVVYFFGIILLPLDTSYSLTCLGLSMFFLSVVALRLMCVLTPRTEKAARPKRARDDELPVYSILVPLFRETSVVGQLVSALDHLDYPKHLLDIKLVLEETDIAMHRIVARMELPSYFEVIVVPAGKPQTKPRALNYALQFARGELVTIYDAEDVPEPDQLRKAVFAFAQGPANLACLQAELTFYNANENWLTRQFTVEYAILFGLILPSLAHEKLPLPLGGTSNHFRTKILRDVGAWDPFNMTEDADLGLRLARHNYLTQVLDSKTFEEANTELGNWIQQRARWFKGFLQTWLVHMRSPWVLQQQIGWDGVWIMHTMTFGTVFSSLIHPIFTGIAAYQIWCNWNSSEPDTPVKIALAGISLVVTGIGFGASLYAGYLVTRRKGLSWWPVLLTMPFYWLLMGIAAWLSLWQFIVAPFHWNKTKHGMSSLTTKSEAYFWPVATMIAGPKIITKITGRKNKIIGTVSFGGKAAAFFSASAIRSFRFSWARTRSAEPSGVPYRSD